MSKTHVYDMIIVGGGPGGYTAAIYAASAGLDTLVLEKLSAGGQMALSEEINNYPGLGLADEAELVGRGVAYCAACDGMRYRGKTVVVVGGGNSAAGDALALSRIAEKVILVHRRDKLRATKAYDRPLSQAGNIEFRWNSAVVELLHGDKLSGARLRDVNTGEETELACDGVFISVGRKPATELVKGQLELDKNGYIAADETTKTSLPGVYAVGDVRTKALRQVVTAVADGAAAVHMAEEYLAGGE